MSVLSIGQEKMIVVSRLERNVPRRSRRLSAAGGQPNWRDICCWVRKSESGWGSWRSHCWIS